MEQFYYKDFRDLSTCIRNNISQLPTDINLVVGIPRSGVIPAYMIALFMNIQACSLDEFINDIHSSHGERMLKRTGNSKKKVLVVDDSIHSGIALKKTKDRLKNKDTDNLEIYFLAVYAREQSCNLVDFYFEIVDLPRFFQWNYLNMNIATRSCYDIDGVLCVDPTEKENDDGEIYRNFLRTAKPLFIPNQRIHSLVTSRLEKYRAETEFWLKLHGVEYGTLYMLDLPSKQERIRLKAHATFKADIYRKLSDTVLFVESNPNQAKQIFELTGKATICVETDELLQENLNSKIIVKEKNSQTKQNIKKKCLLYSHELTYTGAPHSLLRIAKILKENNYIVEIWSPEDGDFKNEIEKVGIRVQIVPYVALTSAEKLKKISAFDLAIANTVICHRFYDVAHKLIPTIWFIREGANLSDICDPVQLRKQLLSTSNDLYCVSEYAKEIITRNYNKNVKVLHNCVEDFYCIEDSKKTENTVNFIALGTFNKRKAFDVCIKAFEKLPKNLQEKSHFYFAGRLNENLSYFWTDLINKIEINPNITYLGEIKNTDEKISVLKKMNVFVVASLDESCSLVALEGAMLSKALIVSENVGAKYLVNDSSGWIVKTGDDVSLSNALKEAIVNQEKLETMGEESRNNYLKTSTIAKYKKEILSMVEDKIAINIVYDDTYKKDSYSQNELEMQNQSLIRQQKYLQEEILNIKKSVTYKIGRSITFLPRKVRGGIRCYKENGLRYTIQRVKVKIKSKLKKR